MLEETGDLWTIPADARCITTNGVTNQAGKAIMGSGCALEAKNRYPGIDSYLGSLLKAQGNHVHALTAFSPNLLTFPTKNDWRKPSDLDLISRSCDELMGKLDQEPWTRVLIPRPGCGAGQLDWDIEVRPAIFSLLDDRVVIVTYSGASGRS